MKYSVAVFGVSGYSGLELMRIMLRHPAMRCAAVMASEATGARLLADIHPQLRGLTGLVTQVPDAGRLSSAAVDTVFLCTPNESSHELAPRLLASGMRVIDFSGSFRLRDAGLYREWYGFDHAAPELLGEAVYGLPEWNAASIRCARLLANPGCYPTSVLLALLPLTRAGLVAESSEIICDSKSGVTGAGRSARTDLLFPEVSGSFRAYNPLRHRHAPEMCQELQWAPGHFTFVPHLLPVNRGILSTIYVSLAEPQTSGDIAELFHRCYGNHPFVRILGDSGLPELRAVNHTNFCDIAWRLSAGGRRAVLFSAIDNLVKGAAGQAVQNFNLMHGLAETTGLLETGDSCA